MSGDKRTQSACALCFEPVIESLGFIESLVWDDSLCWDCRQSLNYDFRVVKHGTFKINVLHEYKDEIRQCILRYKDKGDIYLARIFLVPFRWRVLFFYHDYVVISVPSSKERILERGFDHASLLAKSLGLEYIDNVLENRSEIRQAEKTREERMKIKDSIYIKNIHLIQGKKVLLVDDVMTTGSTMLACHELLKASCEKVVGLCVANVSNL